MKYRYRLSAVVIVSFLCLFGGSLFNANTHKVHAQTTTSTDTSATSTDTSSSSDTTPTLPPTTPLVVSVESTESGVVIKWSDSQPGTFPIDHYDVQRSENNADYVTVASVTNATTYTDAAGTSGEWYRIIAVDDQTPANQSDPSTASQVPARPAQVNTNLASNNGTAASSSSTTTTNAPGTPDTSSTSTATTPSQTATTPTTTPSSDQAAPPDTSTTTDTSQPAPTEETTPPAPSDTSSPPSAPAPAETPAPAPAPAASTPTETTTTPSTATSTPAPAEQPAQSQPVPTPVEEPAPTPPQEIAPPSALADIGVSTTTGTSTGGAAAATTASVPPITIAEAQVLSTTPHDNNVALDISAEPAVQDVALPPAKPAVQSNLTKTEERSLFTSLSQTATTTVTDRSSLEHQVQQDDQRNTVQPPTQRAGLLDTFSDARIVTLNKVVLEGQRQVVTPLLVRYNYEKQSILDLSARLTDESKKSAKDHCQLQTGLLTTTVLALPLTERGLAIEAIARCEAIKQL